MLLLGDEAEELKPHQTAPNPIRCRRSMRSPVERWLELVGLKGLQIRLKSFQHLHLYSHNASQAAAIHDSGLGFRVGILRFTVKGFGLDRDRLWQAQRCVFRFPFRFRFRFKPAVANPTSK